MRNTKKQLEYIRNFLSEKHINGVSVFMFVAVCLGLYLNWHPIQIVIFLLIIWMILMSPSGWQMARWSLIFFVLMAFSILIDNSSLVEQFSVGMMIFLFFSVIKISVEKE
ncbi:MAG TPA: hypothetical protein VJK08_01025 [Patescibacteria group bacterium]|nr:hypothetical protein [Patescibacteria group bacterium]